MRKKILIVEDHNDSREIMNLFITKMGHETIAAKKSDEAIAFAEAEKPDLIFMDIQLPDVDGVKTTAILKQNPKPLTSLSWRLRHGCQHFGRKKL